MKYFHYSSVVIDSCGRILRSLHSITNTKINMKTKLFTFTILPALALILIAPSAYAFGGQGMGQGFGKGEGMHGMGGMRGGLGPVPEEMREAWREDCDDLTLEERQARREEMRAQRDEHRAEMESFIGYTREEMRELHRSGESMSDVLEEQGITESEAEAFLTEQANERVDNIVARHDLDSDEEKTLRDRIADFVQNILDRWFD